MALKSTIFKANLAIADMDRHYYAEHPLTLARHPSETDERMMMRLLAFALLAQERLAFGKGLSDVEEPDLWQKDLTGAIETWVEVGLPDERRLARACGRAGRVVVLAYGGAGATVWWRGIEGKLKRLSNLEVLYVPQEASRGLAELARRFMGLTATIQDGQVLLGSEEGAVSVEPEVWKASGRG